MFTAKGRQGMILVVTIVLLTSTLFTGASASASPDTHRDRMITSQVSAERAIEHIRALSEKIGPRVSGLKSEKEGAKYITSQLRKYGYQVQQQSFPVNDQYIGHIRLPGGDKWQAAASPEGRMTERKSVSGDLISVGKGLADGDYPDNAAGKIVLIQYEAASRNEQLHQAVEHGATGVLFYNTVGFRGNYGSTFTPRFNESVDIPVLGIAWIHGQWLMERLEKGRLKIDVKTEHHRNLTSLNVVASSPAATRDPKAPAVLVTAHMDSVIGASGANDNASGSGMALELARVMKNVPTDTELRFIFFGSEERGVLGSRHYVRQLSDEEASRIVGVFNADMVATSYHKVTHLYAMTLDGKPNRVSDAAIAAGERLNHSSVAHGRFGSSDHVPFHERGIPAALFIWMRVDSWDPLIYEIEKVYHTPQDTLKENVSPERMQTVLEVIGTAAYELTRKQAPAQKQQRKAG